LYSFHDFVSVKCVVTMIPGIDNGMRQSFG